ncbi:hypothetical protein BGX31_003074 [Mortierella sp. GBA43]|nr:hypothetical protein BGX31_003074 [Mortierella sp. GBA43]
MQGFSVNGPQSHNHARTLPNRSLPSVGSSRTLADRKLVAISEISRRFVIGSRSQHPNPAAAHDPTKHRKPSGLARNIILPTTNTGVSSAKSKRKTKFTPPLVSGGYAERLANLMSYHRSEYSMWANATLRQDKLFGSTEPLAVVEITDLSMDHHLQWAQCKVIHSEHNRPPFDTDASLDRTNDDERLEDCVSQTQPNDTSEAVNEPETDIVTSTPCHLIDGFVVEEEEEDDAASDGVEITGSTVVEIVTSTPPDCIGGFTENDSMVGTYTEEDSINGLHMDVHKMGVVSSSQGSVPGSSMGSLFKSQQHWTMHEAAKLHSIVEDEPPTKLVQILKSSQGSEDEAEWNESLLEEVSVFPKQILAKDHRLRKSSPVKQYSPQGDVPEGDRSMESGPAMSSETDPVLKTMSVGSVIDDKSSESDGGTMGMIFTPQENPTLSASTPHTATTGPTFTIIFSKLFNCATLKVTDKVEIHEPCHRIVTPDCGESAHDSAVWIVERYKVVSD